MPPNVGVIAGGVLCRIIPLRLVCVAVIGVNF
jgi:hypothetical protein